MSRRLRSTAAFFAASLLVTAVVPALAGVSVVGPRARTDRNEKHGFEYGLRAAVSAPTDDADGIDPGFDGAVYVTTSRTRTAAAFVELGYSHWPSRRAGEELDRLFTVLTPVHGTKVFVDAVQLSGHARVAPLPGRAASPWMELGVGIVRSNGTVRFPVEQLEASGWTVIQGTTHSITYSPVFDVGAGLDFALDRGMRVGPDAAFRWVYFEEGRQFVTTFCMGGHVRFGKP